MSMRFFSMKIFHNLGKLYIYIFISHICAGRAIFFFLICQCQKIISENSLIRVKNVLFTQFQISFQ